MKKSRYIVSFCVTAEDTGTGSTTEGIYRGIYHELKDLGVTFDSLHVQWQGYSSYIQEGQRPKGPMDDSLGCLNALDILETAALSARKKIKEDNDFAHKSFMVMVMAKHRLENHVPEYPNYVSSARFLWEDGE